MIAIIDYGMGNISSIINAFAYWQKEVKIVDTPKGIEDAAKLILPGVGSFKEAMISIHQKDLVSPLRTAVIDEKKPVLGICLGMQMMALEGYEDGWSKGLGWFEGEVVPLLAKNEMKLSIPHMGFNAVVNPYLKTSSLLGMEKKTDYYFCHSYQLISQERTCHFGVAHHGENFIASIEQNNIWGTQFHPEKSQSNGLMLIKRFLSLGSQHA